MNRRIIQHQVRQYIFPIIGLMLILSALPFSVWQITKKKVLTTEASSFQLVPYPGILWSPPKNYTVSFVKNAQTQSEEIFYSNGQSVTAETNKNISNEVYFFYKQLLISKGYSEIRISGNPQTDTNWVATYESDNNICQLQYYPTPYEKEKYTVLLFFGNL